MITTDKVTEISCILDEFCKNLDAELTKNLHIAPIDEGYKRMRNRKGQMSKSEIMTILLCYHFETPCKTHHPLNFHLYTLRRMNIFDQKMPLEVTF